MIGKKHLQHAQRGGGGAEAGGKVRHTVDELHSIPEGLINEILRQLNELRPPNIQGALQGAPQEAASAQQPATGGPAGAGEAGG